LIMPPRSKIAQFPEEVRAWLHQAFVERAFGDIVGITAELNAKLKEAGVAIYVGKSAVGAESQKVRRAQESIRATTEAAKLIAESAKDDGDDRSAAVMALLQADMFEVLLKMREAEEQPDDAVRLGLLVDASLGMARLSKARIGQAEWRAEVMKRAKAEAAAITKIAKDGGMSKERVDEIRARILGIAPKASEARG
jgi:Protein of unknown function (DUF3486)